MIVFWFVAKKILKYASETSIHTRLHFYVVTDSLVITIILNNLQTIHMFQLCLKVK